MLVDLEVTICRQDRLSDPQPRSDGERPLPLRIGPMEARRDLVHTLEIWSKHVAGRAGIPAPASDFAGFLTSYLPTITTDPDAGQLADEVGYCVVMCTRAVDKPLQMTFVGPCDLCGCDLFSHPRSLIVACRQVDCTAEYKVAERREWLLLQARDQLLSAAEISRALPGLLPQQTKLTSSMIRGWCHHGRISQRPPHPARPREPRYVVGEILDILAEIHVKEVGRK